MREGGFVRRLRLVLDVGTLDEICMQYRTVFLSIHTVFAGFGGLYLLDLAASTALVSHARVWQL